MNSWHITAAKSLARDKHVEYLEPLELYTKRALFKFNQPLFMKKLQTRVKLRKRGGSTIFASGLSKAHAGRILRMYCLTEAELSELTVEACEVNSEACADEHSKLYKREFERQFGRKPEVADFRICAIGRDEFCDEVKEKLRELKYCQFMWLDVAHARRGFDALVRFQMKKLTVH